MPSSIQRKNYAALGLPAGPYTHSVVHGNTLYTSGITALGSSAQSQGIENQLKEIYKQIEYICTQNGASLSDLLKVTIYITDMEELSVARETLFTLYGEHIPASALIQVNGLYSPELKVEVEAIIAVDMERH